MSLLRASRARLEAMWRGATPSVRRAVAVIMVAFAVVPLGVTLLREGDFSSSVQIEPTPQTAGRAFQQSLPAPGGDYVADLAATEATHAGVFYELDFLLTADQVGDRLQAVDRLGLRATLTARVDTPARAEELARVAGEQVLAASSREVDAEADRRLADVRRLLPGARPLVREALREQERELRKAAATPPSRIYPKTNPTEPAVTGVNSAIDALPGPFPPKPNPLLALLAGLTAGSALSVILLATQAARRPQDHKDT